MWGSLISALGTDEGEASASEADTAKRILNRALIPTLPALDIGDNRGRIGMTGYRTVVPASRIQILEDAMRDIMANIAINGGQHLQ